jgi:hypothetical protein
MTRQEEGEILTALNRIRPNNSQMKLMKPPANNFGAPTAFAPIPGFPGQKVGMTYDDVQEWNNNAKKTRGFRFSLGATAIQTFNIPIAGTAKWLLGVALHAVTNFDDDTLVPNSASIMLNNELIIQDHPFSSLDIKYIDDEYYSFVRPLSGQDAINLIIDNTNGANQDISATFYYI